MSRDTLPVRQSAAASIEPEKPSGRSPIIDCTLTICASARALSAHTAATTSRTPPLRMRLPPDLGEAAHRLLETRLVGADREPDIPLAAGAEAGGRRRDHARLG